MNESTDAETADATTGAPGQGPAGTEYVPSPSERVRDQVARYEATGGADGGELGGLPVVILTTTGARKREDQEEPGHAGGAGRRSHAAIASYAGNPENPRWYYNLLAHPYATVQDGPEIRRVRAREAFDEEKQGWWEVADALNPNYARYRATAGRDIPILALEPAEWADEVGSANRAATAVTFVRDCAHGSRRIPPPAGQDEALYPRGPARRDHLGRRRARPVPADQRR